MPVRQTDGSNNIYIGDAGVAGESDVIGIGGNPAGTPYTACFIGGIAGRTVSVDAVPVFVDVTGQLGTVMAGSKGTSPLRRGKGVQPQAMFNGKVEKLQTMVAEQRKQIETLTAQFKEQAAQIQKVSAQLEASKPAPRMWSTIRKAADDLSKTGGSWGLCKDSQDTRAETGACESQVASRNANLQP